MVFTSGSTGPYNRAASAEKFYDIAFRKKIYENLSALQDIIDKWIHYYNLERPTAEVTGTAKHLWRAF
jgi:transposase InsO family protein